MTASRPFAVSGRCPPLPRDKRSKAHESCRGLQFQLTTCIQCIVSSGAVGFVPGNALLNSPGASRGILGPSQPRQRGLRTLAGCRCDWLAYILCSRVTEKHVYSHAAKIQGLTPNKRAITQHDRGPLGCVGLANCLQVCPPCRAAAVMFSILNLVCYKGPYVAVQHHMYLSFKCMHMISSQVAQDLLVACLEAFDAGLRWQPPHADRQVLQYCSLFL